jgi:uncharacterized coiled-coil protein SlyX
MPDREYVYQFKLDAAQAKREAAQIVRVFNTALRDIELKPKISVASMNTMGQQVQQTLQKQLAQVQVKAPAGGANAIDPFKEQLKSAKLLRDELRDREKEEKLNLAILSDQTSQLKMQEALLGKREIALRRQARDAQATQLGMNPSVLGGIRNATHTPTARGPMSPMQIGGELIPGFGQLQSMMGYSIAGVAIAELGRRAIDTTIALTNQGTALRRNDFAAQQLAGSTDKLNSLLRVYQQVTGGVQTTGESTGQLKQIMALGYADNDSELRRFLSASLGSSRGTGNELSYTIGELQMTIANQSKRRLDQLGLGIEEFDKQLDNIKKSMPELSDEAAFQEALLTALNEKYGALVTGSEAGASGLELLTERFRELREEMARNTEQRMNPIFEATAVQMGSQNIPAQVRQLRAMADSNSNPFVEMMAQGNQGQEAEAFRRTANLLEEVNAAANKGQRGMEGLQGKVLALSTAMNEGGQATAAQIAQLDELERQYQLTANGGIVYADAMDEASQAARRLAAAQEVANATFAEAQRLLRTSYNGTMYVNLPGVGLQPAQGPALPSDDYMRQRSIMQSGGFLTPGGGSIGDLRSGWQEQWRQQNEQMTRDAIREQEQAQKDSIRESERAWKDAAKETQQAFSEAAEDLKSKIESIPGVMGNSQVTADQMKMAGLGVGQNFADDIRRRLEDEVINKHDWADIDPSALFARAGIDQSLPDEAKMALFNQKWNDSTLFANRANLDLFNQDAIKAEMERQRMSETGQQNILGMFGLGTDDKGQSYFKDLGGIMKDGFMGGAEDGLAEFGKDAIANVMLQLRSDSALQQYGDLGSDISDAIWGGFMQGTEESDLVGTIAAVVMRQINDAYDNNP